MGRFQADVDARWDAIRGAKRESHVRTLAHIDARALARGTYASGSRVRQHLAADELYLANLAVDLRGLALSERRACWGPQRLLLTNARLAKWCIGRIDKESKWLRSLVPDRFKGIAADDIRAYFESLEKLRSRQSTSISAKLRSVGGD